MKRLLFAIFWMVGGISLAFAQDASSRPYTRFEVFAGYSAIETNEHTFHFRHPSFNVINTDFDEGGKDFEVAVMRNLTRYVGVMGETSRQILVTTEERLISLWPSHSLHVALFRRARRSTQGCSSFWWGLSSSGATTHASLPLSRRGAKQNDIQQQRSGRVSRAYRHGNGICHEGRSRS